VEVKKLLPGSGAKRLPRLKMYDRGEFDEKRASCRLKGENNLLISSKRLGKYWGSKGPQRLSKLKKKGMTKESLRPKERINKRN